MVKKPFCDPGIRGSDGKLYVEGPVNGCGYDHGTLWPNLRFSTKPDVQAAAEIANSAFAAGYRQAQRDMRAALGLKE